MVRKANVQDAPRIMAMIDQARQVLAHHQSGQWQGKEPSLQTILHDIAAEQYWVYEQNQHIVAGASVGTFDPDYETLIEGAWLNQEPYRVFHRVVVDVHCHRQGIGRTLLQALEQQIRLQGVYNIKVDTHVRNVPMIQLLRHLGYVRCGVVILQGHLIREAFQKIVRS